MGPSSCKWSYDVRASLRESDTDPNCYGGLWRMSICLAARHIVLLDLDTAFSDYDYIWSSDTDADGDDWEGTGLPVAAD